MSLKYWVNREFKGSDFNGFNYDHSLTPEELKKIDYPYCSACIELEDDVVIAVDSGELSPRDFIEQNQNTKFILDAFKHPRKINSFLGNVKMFYAKQILSENLRENQIGSFALDIFKNGDSLIGVPRVGYSSPMMVDFTFIQLEKLLDKIRITKNNLDKIYDFSESEIGSASFQVDFTNEEPSYIVKFETKGISYNDIVKITEQIYKDIPANRK